MRGFERSVKTKNIKMTKRESLEIVVSLWRWIERNPLGRKKEWPGWEKLLMEPDDPYCACCFYVDYRDEVNKFGADCIPDCPMIGFWWGFTRDPVDFDDGPCLTKGSPFTLWRQAKREGDEKVAKRCAGTIRRGAEKALKELKQKQSI